MQHLLLGAQKTLLEATAVAHAQAAAGALERAEDRVGMFQGKGDRLLDQHRLSPLERGAHPLRAPFALAAIAGERQAHAQTQAYPSRPIRWIVPVPAGATADIVTRTIGHKLGERLGQQVIVENRPGGVFVIGSEALARAAPDGY